MFLSLTKVLRRLRQELVQRRLPHGLIGPAYLWPSRDARVVLHRRLWWHGRPGWPRWLWLSLELWLWLRWVGWHAWLTSVRAVRGMGPGVAAEEGISLIRQGGRILKLALFWCIPPGESYRFRLYREPAAVLDYVYPHEAQAFHTWRNAALGDTTAAQALLQDKTRLAEVLGSLGIPVVPNHALVQAGTSSTVLTACIVTYGRVFCKLNNGARGEGAFAAWTSESGLRGRSLAGEKLPDAAAVAAAWRNLCLRDTALVQPCLSNHPALAELAPGGEAITLRLITETGAARSAAGITCLHASLEVPLGQDEDGVLGYAIVPIDAVTGKIGTARKHSIVGNDVLLSSWYRVAALAEQIERVPDWNDALCHSVCAHEQFPGVRAIAWDWVLTPNGPMLLEGNTGFGVAFQNDGCRLISRAFLSDNQTLNKAP